MKSIFKLNRQNVFREQIAADGDIQELLRVIKPGWPDKKKCPPAVQPYYDERSELVESQGLVFRGEQLVVPLSLLKDMLIQLHRSHIGTGGCVRRAREILYWPRMRNKRLCFALYNLSNIPSRTGSRGASTT